MSNEYNWWEDPKNKEEVERISWWNHPENKEYFRLPISVIRTDNVWVATCNDDTKVFLGEHLHGCAQGDTKEEAIQRMFELIQLAHNYSEECRRKYQRWVPFRKGAWNRTGGTWFVIFGIHFYFRRGKGMKGGRYIPFTKLNLSIYSEWAMYKRWKTKNQ